MQIFFGNESSVNMPQGAWPIIVLVSVIAIFVWLSTLLTSQSGKEYARERYESRKNNEKKAKDKSRKNLLDGLKKREEDARRKERKLQSQSGLPFNLEDYFTSISLGPVREGVESMKRICKEFNLELPSIPTMSSIMDKVGTHWPKIRNSELLRELQYVLQCLITLGWLKKLDFKIKGQSILSSEPLRHRVTIVELIEASVKFVKLFSAKLIIAITTQDITALWSDANANAYDDEYTFIMSQKVLIDLGRGPEVDAETYDRRVEECVQTTLSYLDTCKSSERSYYSTRLAQLRNIQSSRILSAKENIREKPYGFLLFGASSVGKSAIVNSVLRFILKSNGRDASPRACVTLNSQDKFDSEFMTYHDGVILDDLCNTREDKQEGSPVESVIMFLNQVPMAALNPNADMKGKVMIQPSVVAATTNVKDLESGTYSNEPLSINRRFNATITQEVKPEYRKAGTEMLDTDKISHMADMQFPTYALFTVETPRYAVGSSSSSRKDNLVRRKIEWIPVEFEGKPLIQVEIDVLLRFLKEDSAKHFAQQKAFVAGQKKLEDMPLCEASGMPPSLCSCCLESQTGLADLQVVKDWFFALEERCCVTIEDMLKRFMNSRYGNALLAYYKRQFLYAVALQYIGHLVCVLVTLLWLDLSGVAHTLAKTYLVVALYVTYVCGRVYVERARIVKRLTTVPRPSQWFANLSVETKTRALGFIALLGIWNILRLAARRWKTIPSAQAAPCITTMPRNAKPWQEEKEFWDRSAVEEQYKIGTAGTTHQARSACPGHIDSVLQKRLMVLELSTGEFCNAVPLRSNAILIPNHVVPKKVDFVTLRRVGTQYFRDLPLSVDTCERIPGTDLSIWYCPGAGPQKDLTPLLPKDIYELKKFTVRAFYNKDGTVVSYPPMTATRKRIYTNSGGSFQGLEYYFPVDTFGGLCMATLVGQADKNVEFIAGFHLAGKGRTGAAGFVTRTQVVQALTKLDGKPGVLISHSSQPMAEEIMGVKFGPLTAPHEKCVTNTLSADAKIRVHGAHNQPHSSPTSAVVTSVISPAVEKIMSIPKIHGPPTRMGGIEHKELDISGKVDTATRFDPKFMQKAYMDYEKQLASLPKEELKLVAKISDDANLAGLDGVLGVNAMNFKTSMGFPLKGPKTNYTELSDRHVEGISCPRDVDPMILEEVARMEKVLLSGQSINAVFKASLKDEPTKMTKKKVRVFAAANMPMVMLVRKYFLNCAALVQRNKKEFECAVGVVVQSPEWTELFNHIGKYGWDRAIAGDYAKFDGRMSPDFMFMAFKLLITIAERSGNYDEDDLMIMRGIASEITYPTYDYFGTLVQFFGSNPSGHPLTVIINSLVNSLYLRYVYYKIAADEGWFRVPPFNRAVAAMTYGDDNIMTVKKGFDAFNHTRVAAELAEVGITYTMADKDAESVPFINLGDASFLKHFAKWDAELGLYRSPVEEASIAKMLHTHLESGVLSMEQSSAEAIQNVALKYFEFGREVYEEKVAELREVANASGITGYVGHIPSYDERVEWYKGKYELESQSGYKHTKHVCDVNSKEEQLQLKCIADMPIKCTAKEYSFPGGRSGDLLFIAGHARLIVAVEVKVCQGGPKLKKALQQAREFGLGLKFLYPNHEVISAVYTLNGFRKVIHANKGKAIWDELPKLPF